MTDITDIQRREVRNTARTILDKPYDHTAAACELASFVLATVDAPPRTLAEELQYRAALLDNGDPDGDTPQALRDLAARAAQMEHDLTEARAEVERERDLGVAVGHERDEVSEALAVERRRVEKIAAERDEARAEVERVTAERNRIASGRYITYAEVDGKTVQKGAESNAETPNPADVKPGEAWVVNIDGAEIVPGFKTSVGWICYRFFGGTTKAIGDERITLVSRLVPAPRVITNPDELDRLAASSVILSSDGDAWQKSSETSLWASPRWTTSDGEPSMWASCRLCDEDHPVTVLWEPEA
ncbi:hypothetical protein ACYB2S_13830 [Corynebacterium variabile]|uniref:hypothetical protein n=1 Tax=Corynebacterium variabile TaxID=1727 RepID=UPI003CAEAD90